MLHLLEVSIDVLHVQSDGSFQLSPGFLTSAELVVCSAELNSARQTVARVSAWLPRVHTTNLSGMGMCSIVSEDTVSTSSNYESICLKHLLHSIMLEGACGLCVEGN